MPLTGVVGAVIGIGLFAPQALAAGNGSSFLNHCARANNSTYSAKLRTE